MEYPEFRGGPRETFSRPFFINAFAPKRQVGPSMSPLRAEFSNVPFSLFPNSLPNYFLFVLVILLLLGGRRRCCVMC